MDMPAIFSGITPGDGLFQYENDGLDMEATIVKKWIGTAIILPPKAKGSMRVY